jgi:ketosteroid isomerase-like protein
MNEAASIKLMDQLAQAFNRHDRDALLAMVTEDCVFDTAAGPEAFGARHVGRDAVGKAFSAVWTTFPNASWNEAKHVACGDRGFSEWTFRGADRNGVKVEVRGVDLFVFRGGLIARKDTFRKNRSQ